MKSRLFDSSILATSRQAVEFVSNILESSTEYSVIGKDLDGKILLWNEGARRMYGYDAEEVVGELNSDVLHTPEDVAAGKPREIMDAALRDGKWEGVIGRIRKDGRRISARVVITPRLDPKGKPVGLVRRTVPQYGIGVSFLIPEQVDKKLFEALLVALTHGSDPTTAAAKPTHANPEEQLLYYVASATQRQSTL